MPNRRYEKGHRFELRVKKMFEDKGAFVARQGKSAFPDLIMIRSTIPHGYSIAVECKTDGRLSRDEHKEACYLRRNFFHEFRVYYRDRLKPRIIRYKTLILEGDGGIWV